MKPYTQLPDDLKNWHPSVLGDLFCEDEDATVALWLLLICALVLL